MSWVLPFIVAYLSVDQKLIITDLLIIGPSTLYRLQWDHHFKSDHLSQYVSDHTWLRTQMVTRPSTK